MSDLKDLAKNPAKLGEWPPVPKLVEIGLFGAHSGQMTGALSLFQGLLQASPELIPAKLGMAFIDLVTNQFDRAETTIREVLTKKPDHPEALALLGLNLALSGRQDEAEPILVEVAKGTGASAELARFLLTGQ
ncbi:MAG: tetratricopeptide repeat protein [Deltaproteobacteria bacterium]|nr:tetratricopeptide repeat protein [Deltaproteobacteria bacterium]